MEKFQKNRINIIIFENGNKPYCYIGKVLKEYRLTSTYTLEDLAFILNTSTQDILDIEEDKLTPTNMILVYRLFCLYNINLNIVYEKLQ